MVTEEAWSWFTWLLPLLYWPLVMVPATYMSRQEHSGNVGRTAVSVHVSTIFLQNMTYTLVIPSSYDVALGVGEYETFSGTIVSAHPVGVAVGSLCMWAVLQRSPGIWRSGRMPWLLMMCSACMSVVGACGYSYVLFQDAGDVGMQARSSLAALLLISRFADGMGAGLNMQLAMMQTVHCISPAERGEWLVTNQFAVMFGTGCGPMVSSLTSALTGTASNVFAGVGGSYIGVGLASLVSVIAFYPRTLEGVADEQCEVEVASVKPLYLGPLDTRVVRVCLFLSMTAIRGFVITGLECATALILEEDYQWDDISIGYVIGICFLMSGPAKLVYNYFRDSSTTRDWVRMYTAISLLGAILFFSNWGALFGSGAISLFVADCLLFPSLFLADALAAGLIVGPESSLPEDSWCSPNMIMAYRAIAVSGVGRALAGPLSRMIVAWGGRDAFAVQQLISTLLWISLFEAFGMVALPKRYDKKAQVSN